MTAPVLDPDLELDPEPNRDRRGRRLLWLALVLGAVAAAGAAYWLLVRDSGSSSAEGTSGPVATAEVTRESISATSSVDGVLGHGEPNTVTASGQGVITQAAEPGTAVERGTELYRLNEQPVIALIGDVPMYRDLRSGDTGRDVEQLEANLAALGYDGFTVDDEYTDRTADAVEEWQEDVGAAETGVVPASGVVFVSAGGAVDTVHADVGTVVAPGEDVLDISGSADVVELEAEVENRSLLEVGTAVTVVLPDGSEVSGQVVAAEVVTTPAGQDGGEGGGEDEETVLEVDVALGEDVDDALGGASVDVAVTTETREDVLVVPVTALLALAEGGYGLEVVADDGSTEIVAVETGLFANGKVEVEGGGIDEGTVVGVAGR